MAAPRIVLILGAGASAPYGFPTGIGLIEQICKEFPHHAQGMGKRVPFAERRREAAEEFTETLARSGRRSIDLFLQHNPRYRNIGKLAIARALLPKESEKGLFSVDAISRTDHWYARLLNMLARGDPERFPQVSLAIITYNYDRSLEHFFMEGMKSSYEGLDQASAAALLHAMPIVHLHGQLGLLPWQAGDGPRVGYGGSPQPSGVVATEAAQHIKIIYEDIAETPELRQAHELLAGAETVIFLGFGYDPVNLERLKLQSCLRPDAAIVGTAHGLTKMEREYVRARLGRLAGNDRQIELVDLTNLDFLRETHWFQLS